MSGGIEIIILLAVAVLLLVRLIGVLGTRDGFEPEKQVVASQRPANDTKVVDPKDDFDIETYGKDQSIKAALMKAKAIEPSFRVDEFLVGSKAAYEMILMAFLNGDLSDVKGFIEEHVYDGFQSAIDEREKAGHHIEANFVGIKNVELKSADFNEETKELVLGVEYAADLTQAVLDEANKLVSGDKNKVETEIDHWQFARVMGSDDPNWTLIATDE